MSSVIWPFRPQPPVSLTHKVHLERQLREIVRQAGRLPRDPEKVVLPSDLETLINTDDNDQLPQRIFHAFATRLPMPSDDPELLPEVKWAAMSLLSNSGEPQAVQKTVEENGRISCFQIDSSLKNSLPRLASVCLEAACECWFQSVPDDQQKTLQGIPIGVAAVPFGLSPVFSNVSDEVYGGAENGASGGLASSDHGYLMSVAEYSIGIDYSAWMGFYRADCRRDFKAGLKYLQKTSDSILPTRLAEKHGEIEVAFDQQQLTSDQPGKILSTLIDMASSKQCPENSTADVCQLLGHHEPEVRRWAAAVLRSADSITEHQLADIYGTIDDSAVPVRVQAILALRPGYDRDEDVVDRLVDFLGRPERKVVEASVVKLAEYTEYPDRTVPQVLKAIHTMAVKGAPDEMFPIAIRLLSNMTENPDSLVQEHFADDPTLLSMLFGSSEADEET